MFTTPSKKDVSEKTTNLLKEIEERRVNISVGDIVEIIHYYNDDDKFSIGNIGIIVRIVEGEYNECIDSTLTFGQQKDFIVVKSINDSNDVYNPIAKKLLDTTTKSCLIKILDKDIIEDKKFVNYMDEYDYWIEDSFNMECIDALTQNLFPVISYQLTKASTKKYKAINTFMGD